MTETWRPVEGFPYEVSSLGRVRRGERIISRQRVPKRCGVYLKVDLWRRGRRTTRTVHRLVALAFIPNPQHKHEVNHLDLNTLNPRAENLEWATRSENEQHKRFMEATA